ncbi:MAG: DNRLRE domain-containing protein [Oscillospiraceae bacterium]|nr:DNRLRE domain-containing protein [Oscillospiraceae bacterium]
MKRSRNKIIVLIMLLAMILGTTGTAAPLVQSTVQENAPVQRIQEIVSLRETNSETYLLSNGNYECVIYAGDKYYRDGRNALKPIDNTLVLDEVTAKTDRRHYKNTANSFQVTFSDSEIPTVTMTKGSHGITFRTDSASGGNPFHTTADSKAVTVGAVRNCNTLTQLTDTGSDTIMYTNAFYNTDIVYVLQNDALKEYIVLKSSHAPNVFRFRFSMEGLTLEAKGSTGVFLDENKEEVFRLDQLFAIDGTGEMTEDLSYTFTPVKGGRDILITITLDEAYLTADDRVYPVVIDPSVMISSAKTADASVYSAKPDTNYQMEKRLRTGRDTTYGKRRAYLRFDMPSSIPAANVTESVLALKKYSGVDPATRAYRCQAGWSSGTITWNNMPAFTMENLSSESERRSSGSAWFEMDVTDIVKKWLDGSWENYGFAVRHYLETNTEQWTTFYSSDAPSPHKPELHITYTGGDSNPPTEPPALPSVTLNLQYDYAYASGNASAASTIAGQAQTLKNFFGDYGLDVILSTPSRKQSYADAHVNEYDVEDSFCENSSEIEIKDNHFKNAYNILYRISTPNTSSLTMMYVGHNVCFVDADYGHQFNASSMVPLRGLASNSKRIMVITDTRGGIQETLTAIHEFGHMFGITDHYRSDHPPKANTSRYCIYGDRKDEINSVSSGIICPGCVAQMMANIDDYS